MAIVENFPSVEVGNEFHFTIELSIVGLHRLYQEGIDNSKVNGLPIALIFMSSRAHLDELPSSGEQIYASPRGNFGGNKGGGDQKLK